MKFDFNLIMAIVNAVQAVEHVIKGSESKKQKAIEIATTALGVAETASPTFKAKVGEFVDAVVAVHNAQGQ